MSKHQREYKEINTKHYKQKIENLKLDKIELEDLYDDLLFKYREAIKLLEESSKFTKSKLKYDSLQAVKISKKFKVL